MGLDFGVYKKIKNKKSDDDKTLDFLYKHYDERTNGFYGKSFFRYVKGSRFGGYGTFASFRYNLYNYVTGENIFSMHQKKYIYPGKPFHYLITSNSTFIDYEHCEILFYEFLLCKEEYLSIFSRDKYHYNLMINLLRTSKNTNHILIFE